MAELLAPVGVHLALLLPFFVLSMASPDAVREAKVLSQGLAAALVLAGLAIEALSGAPRPARMRLPRLLSAAALGAVLFAAASGIRGLFGWTDPLVLVPIGSAAVLFSVGASLRGRTIRGPAFAVVAFAGALTGLLAFLQRTAGLFRFPVDAPEERFHAVALLGNPGDVGAALVLPAIILAAGVVDGARSRASRSVQLAGLALVILGLGAAEALTPLIAIAAAAVPLLAFRLRRNNVLVSGLVIAALAALLVVGAAARYRKMAAKPGKASVSAAITERDIGFRSSAEMVRARPLLGEGPGNFSNAFVPSRLRAEERAGRRLVHSSPSSHFENAHNEWLTFAAECGLPAALLAALAAGALAFLLARKREALLLSLVVSLGVLGLASFPSRLAAVAGPASFVLGLAFRAVSREEAGPSPSHGRAGKAAALGAAGLLLALLSVVRGRAVLLQAEGEAALRAAAAASPPERPELLELSRKALQESVALRGRYAPAWLALGSNYRLDRNLDAAGAALLRSLALEERAETDLNLGRVELERGNREEATALFRRAVWILPRLVRSLPPEVSRTALEAELEAVKAGLPRGGPVPPLRLPRP